MAKLSIDNGMQVSRSRLFQVYRYCNTLHVNKVDSILYFFPQTDLSTAMKIEESCYSQVCVGRSKTTDQVCVTIF